MAKRTRTRVKITAALAKRAEFPEPTGYVRDAEGNIALDSRGYPVRRKVVLWDEDLNGFGLRLTPTCKMFVLRYGADGRERLTTLGKWGDITVDEARAIAKELLGKITRSRAVEPERPAYDPIVERKRKVPPATIGELWARWVAEKHPTKKPRSRAEDLGLWSRHLSKLSGTRVTDLDQQAARQLHVRIGATAGKVTANRALALLSSLFRFAELPNPCTGVDRFAEADRVRYPTPDEYQAIGATLEAWRRRGRCAESLPAYFAGLALTGLRATELRLMRWEDLDHTGGRVRLPDAKTGARWAPVSPLFFQLVDDLPIRGPWIFARRDDHDQPMHHPGKAWRAICEEAGVKGLHIHDLRHGLATTATSAGASLRLVGAVLGHRRAETTARYAHVQHDPAAAVASAAASTIAAQMGLDPRKTDQEEET